MHRKVPNFVNRFRKQLPICTVSIDWGIFFMFISTCRLRTVAEDGVNGQFFKWNENIDKQSLTKNWLASKLYPIIYTYASAFEVLSYRKKKSHPIICKKKKYVKLCVLQHGWKSYISLCCFFNIVSDSFDRLINHSELRCCRIQI